MPGFLFAFLRYSHMDEACWMQCLVHLATRSDLIHVAIIPALSPTVIAPVAYTAFIGKGFEEQDVRLILDCPAYDFLFLHTPDDAAWQHGLHFLGRLHGAHYNYSALPLTILPERLKRTVHAMPRWLTHEGDAHTRVFCSQMGLMLCYLCGALPHFVIDPAGCAPADLAHILLNEAGATPHPLGYVGILDAAAWRSINRTPAAAAAT